MQRTFEGDAAEPHSPFEQSEVETSPVELCSEVPPNPGITLRPGALEAYAATMTTEMVQQRQAAWAAAVEKEEALEDAGAKVLRACEEAARGLRFKPYALCKVRKCLSDLEHLPVETEPEPLEVLEKQPLETEPIEILEEQPPTAPAIAESSSESDSDDSDTEEAEEAEEAPEALQHCTEAEDQRLGGALPGQKVK